MSFSIGADKLILGEGDTDVNIVSKNGQSIKINGIVPSAGGGVIPPVGDIDFIGNLNCSDVVGGGSKGIITAEKKLVSGLGGIETTGNVNIKATANLTIEGNGNIDQQGTGKITSGSAGIESRGDIITLGGHDLIVGRDMYFDGQDIYHRTFNPDGQLSYKDFKQLVGKNDANIYTGSNKFRSSAVSIQALNAAIPAVYEDTITLNTNGNIQCKNINNVLEITTGTVVCDNGGTNECKARVFNTRTSGVDGWHIKQALKEDNPPANQANNILQIAATQVQAVGEPVEVYITSSEFDPSNGDNANIKLIPDTVLNGGTIQASKFQMGTADNRYYLKQDIGGVNDQVLQIKAPAANSSVNFKDNVNADVLVVKGTEVKLGATIPINFGNYVFRPQQYSLTRTITIASNADTTNFTNMLFNCRTDTFTNVNAGGSVPFYNAALEGFYKVTVTQTGLSSAGNFDTNDMIFDYVYRLSTQTQPDIIITEPTYGYRKKPTNQARPTIEIDHLNTPVQSQPVFLLYSGQNSGETMPIQVRLTKLDF